MSVAALTLLVGAALYFNSSAPRVEPGSAPVLISLSPSSGPVGTNITIAGTGLTPTGNRINFGSGAVIPHDGFSSLDGRTLTFKVPSDIAPYCPNPSLACPMIQQLITPGAYPVSVANASGQSNSMTFTVTSVTVTRVPKITSISPAVGKIATRVTLTGMNFTSTGNSIKLGGIYVGGLFNSSNGTSITFTVPDGGSPCPPDPSSGGVTCQAFAQLLQGTYPVSVTNANGTSNAVNFTVTAGVAIAPSITSLNPTFGPVGAKVTLTGSGFTPTGNRVNFGYGSVVPHDGFPSSDGRTIVFAVPADVSPYCANPNLACPMTMQQIIPGSYQVSVTNAEGTTNSRVFTVTAGL